MKTFSFLSYTGVVVLIALLGFSCQKKTHIAIQSFDEIYSSVLNTQFDALENHLNAESKELYRKLTDIDYYNADSLVKIGAQYKIPSFCLAYYLYFGLDHEDVSKTDFFKYLINERVSFFDYENYWQATTEHLQKHEDGYFLGIYYVSNIGANMMKWINLTSKDSDELKYDLIYSLGLEENNFKSFLSEIVDELDQYSAEDYYDLYDELSNQKGSVLDNPSWQEIKNLSSLQAQ